ncbi:MAG: hypothetical protein ACREA0_10565, partial [bacterium]
MNNLDHPPFPRSSILATTSFFGQGGTALQHRMSQAGAWVRALFIGMVAWTSANAAEQKENFTFLNTWIQWSDPGAMVIKHLTNQCSELLDKRQAEIAKLRTREDWTARQRHVRAALDRIIGTLPYESS